MDDSISQIDLDKLSIRNTTKVGAHPFGICLDNKRQRLYSANVESNDISVLSTQGANLKRVARIKVGGRPYASALALGGKLLFVTNQDDSTVSVIDTKTLTEIKQIEVGEKPEGISTSTDDRHVYVANWFDGTVSVIDAQTLSVVKTISVADGSRAFGDFISR
jgi:YVTN family beta-propeller protein